MTGATHERHDGLVPFEAMSGFVVGVTAERRADEQIAMLERRGASVLQRNEFDPISREPNYKQCAVRSERVP